MPLAREASKSCGVGACYEPWKPLLNNQSQSPNQTPVLMGDFGLLGISSPGSVVRFKLSRCFLEDIKDIFDAWPWMGEPRLMLSAEEEQFGDVGLVAALD